MSNNFTPPPNSILLAVAIKPHSVKGACKLKAPIDPSLIGNLSLNKLPLTLVPTKFPNSPIQTHLLSYSKSGIIQFEHFHSPEQLKEVLPFQIYIEKNLLPPLENNEFYLSELVGLFVCTPGTKSNPWGQIESYYEQHLSKQIICCIKIFDTQEVVEIPFVKEFFEDINFNEKIAYAIKPDYE